MEKERLVSDPRLVCGLETPWGVVKSIDHVSGEVRLADRRDNWDAATYTRMLAGDIRGWLDTQYVAVGDVIYPPRRPR